MSAFLEISASIIQGSTVGPPPYVVNTADFKVAVTGSAMMKFAYETYIVIPSTSFGSRQTKVDHAASRAEVNNLQVNQEKYEEIVFYDRHHRKQVRTAPLPVTGNQPRLYGENTRRSGHLYYGVFWARLCSHQFRAQTLHAPQSPVGNQMSEDALQRVFQAVIVAKLQYVSCAW